MPNSENLDICPYCKKAIPQGPAYFCPTCGKKLDDKYSNRKVILKNNDDLIDNTVVEDSSMDDMEDITSLIKSNSSFSNDFISDSEDLSLDNLSDMGETSSDLEESSFIDEEDVEVKSLVEELSEEVKESVAEATEKEDESVVEELSEEEDEEVEDESVVVKSDSRVLTLKSKNQSIKLDLFLEYCVDDSFLHNFLRYRIVDTNGDKFTLINRITSSFDLKSIINFKYNYRTSEFENILDSFFKTLKVVDIVQIAENYDVKVSLNKQDLKTNFIEKFYPYDLIIILNNEGLNIRDYLKISVLEQIYLLNDLKLEDKLYDCPNNERSRYDMISCICNQYDESFLISNDKLDIGEDAK